MISISLTSIQDESDEPEFGDVAVALLTHISNSDRGPIPYKPLKTSVIIEGDNVISLTRFADAFLVMFGLMYALHISYPTGLTGTFEFRRFYLV